MCGFVSQCPILMGHGAGLRVATRCYGAATPMHGLSHTIALMRMCSTSPHAMGPMYRRGLLLGSMRPSPVALPPHVPTIAFAGLYTHGACTALLPADHMQAVPAIVACCAPARRDECLTTTSDDRPLLVQFCSSDPQHLLTAARMVEAMGICDGIDINFGCPQRIAKRGNYGAFLMDDLPRVEALVRTLSQASTCALRHGY